MMATADGAGEEPPAPYTVRRFERAEPVPALRTAAERILATARAELGIERELSISWYRRQPGWIAGAFAREQPDRIHVTVDVGEELEYIVRHETAHAAGFGEIEAAYFGIGCRPLEVEGQLVLPSTPTLRPEQWPAELWPAGILAQIERMAGHATEWS